MYFTRTQQKGIVVLCIAIVIIPLTTRWLQKTREYNSIDTEWVIEEARRFRNYLAELQEQRELQQQQQPTFRRDSPRPQKPEDKSGGKHGERSEVPLVIHLNTTDSVELQQIRGIGPAFGRRIVLYRELLGGYHCISQLLEVYGMDSTRYATVKHHLVTDTLAIEKININEAMFGDLVRHPYIDRDLANAILRLREQHGPFTTIGELKRSYLIDNQTLHRIRIYLSADLK